MTHHLRPNFGLVSSCPPRLPVKYVSNVTALDETYFHFHLCHLHCIKSLIEKTAEGDWHQTRLFTIWDCLVDFWPNSWNSPNLQFLNFVQRFKSYFSSQDSGTRYNLVPIYINIQSNQFPVTTSSQMSPNIFADVLIVKHELYFVWSNTRSKRFESNPVGPTGGNWN